MKSSRRLNIITHDIKIHTANFIIYNLKKINSKIAKIINSMSKNNDNDLSTYVKRYNIKYKNILDIGTGGGFPLIVLKIFLDIDNKNTYGMDKTLKKLKVITEKEDIKIIHSRAEIASHDEKYRESFDLVVSRAVSSIENVVEYSSGFVKIGGSAILMRGKLERYDRKKLDKFGFKEVIYESYKLFDEDRSILILEKVKKLDKKLPSKIPKQKS